jgi:hypothetical protein
VALAELLGDDPFEAKVAHGPEETLEGRDLLARTSAHGRKPPHRLGP